MRTLSTIFVLSTYSLALAQPAQPRGPGGTPGGRGNIVERMMERDVNADGKVSKEEVAGTFFERFFDTADANKDGFLTKEEIDSMPPPQRGTGGQGAQGEQASVPSFHESMESAGAAFRLLERADFTAADQTRTYQAIDNLQRSLVVAKSHIADAPIANAAKEKYNSDEAAIRLNMRKGLVDTIEATIVLEKALLNGDTARAKEQMTQIRKFQNINHDVFEPKRGERRGSHAAPIAPEHIRLAMLKYFVHIGATIKVPEQPHSLPA